MSKQLKSVPPGWNTTAESVCPLCNRPMPTGSWNEHHLIPATFKGTEKVAIHIICHDTLHHTFSEKEMQKYYHTIERLLEHEAIQKFVKWVKKQPNDFYSSPKDTKDRKRKRR